MTQILDGAAREAALRDLPGWSFVPARSAIRREIRFADFAAAFAFMTRVALAAERADHHPEWRNVYNRVEIELTTHSVGGLSDKDIALAHHIDTLLT